MFSGRTIYILGPLQLAADRNLSLSGLVQEYLWKALTDQSPSMP